MSRQLEDRVYAAHPLSPAHRMVLLVIARAVVEGQSEVLINRSALARDLDARPTVVGDALMAGEQLGLCRALKNGRVVFTEQGLFAVPPPAPTNGDRPAVRPGPATGEVPVEGSSVQQVIGEFARQWQAAYRQRYVFMPGRDHKLAKALSSLSPTEVGRRVANYLRYPEPFYTECRHAFSIFVRDVNKFGVQELRVEEAPSRIRDADATQRYLEELRRAGPTRPSEARPASGGLTRGPAAPAQPRSGAVGPRSHPYST